MANNILEMMKHKMQPKHEAFYQSGLKRAYQVMTKPESQAEIEGFNRFLKWWGLGLVAFIFLIGSVVVFACGEESKPMEPIKVVDVI